MKLSTQDFLEFEQIKDGIIILKNKGLRTVLMVSSLNFALKSTEEQNAILYQFQNFLNSLDFSCQILVQSRHLNITGYLEKLAEIEKKEENELLKIQITDYRKLIVPFSIMKASITTKKGKLPKISALTEEVFQRCKTQLLQRVEFVVLGLRASGLEAVPLTTLELSELFWSLYHPLEAEQGYYPEIPSELVE